MSHIKSSYLLGTPDLLQESAQFSALSVQSPAHSLVMVGGI